MLVGDLLEVVSALLVAGALFAIVATFLPVGAAVGTALLVIGVFVGYQAQVYADVEMKRDTT